MRVTIVKADAKVSIDGYPILGLDMSSLPDNFHALQWYGNSGEVEYRNQATRYAENVTITSLVPYQGLLDQWTAEKARIDAANVIASEQPAN